MSNISSVGIVGCGWLGTALAHKFKAMNIPVLATRSNANNVAQLKEQGIESKVLSLPTDQAELNNHEVFNNQCLVIAITPQLRHGRVDYPQKIYQLLLAAQQNKTVEKIILLSSTAVYNGLTGEVTEGIELNNKAEKVALLQQAEKIILSFNHSDPLYDLNIPDTNSASKAKRAYVLRLSGLVGPNRHPGRFLGNDRMLKDPQATVNLIHQDDSVGLIISLLEKELSGGIFNGVSETRVSKQTYYQAAAESLALPTPLFETVSPSDAPSSKVVSGKKTQLMLKYQFVHPDLLQWLNECDSQGMAKK